jgi:hypothetical protein
MGILAARMPQIVLPNRVYTITLEVKSLCLRMTGPMYTRRDYIILRCTMLLIRATEGEPQSLYSSKILNSITLTLRITGSE